MTTFVGFLDYLKNMPIPVILCNKSIIKNKEIFEIKYVNESMTKLVESKCESGDVDFSQFININKSLEINTECSTKGDKIYKYITELNTWFCIENQPLNNNETLFYFKEITFDYKVLNNEFLTREDFYSFISDNIERLLEYINNIDKNTDRDKDIMDLFLTFIDENDYLREDLEDGLYINKMSEFTNIIHELITPINLIYSSLQVIERSGVDCLYENPSIIRNINIVKLNIKRVIKIVESIIDFTKLRSGYNDFNPETTNIISFIKNTYITIVDFASEKNIELLFESDLDELHISFDKDKMERILLNLLSNSIKYNIESGVVKISLSTQNGYFIIKVMDNGIGIPKEKIDKIFDKFEKVNRNGFCESKGSGIGLSLVKSMVNLHNGKIDLKSKVGEGTEFIISLPI